MATIKKCDICGKEGATSVKTLVYRTYDATDGLSRYKEPHIFEETIDLCKQCLAKATNIHSVGVMCKEYIIEPIQK